MWRSASNLVLVAAAWCVLVSGLGAVQTRPLTLYGGLNLYPNPAYDSLNLAEFSFSLNRHELEFYRPEGEDSLFYARVFAQVNIFGPRGAVIDSASTYFSIRVGDLQEAAQPGFRLFNKVSLYLPSGIYSARLTVIDAVNKRRAAVFHPSFEVIPPAKDRVALSSVCIAYSVTPVGDNATGVDRRMVRNGYQVIPNPIAIFGPGDRALYLYAEAYNLSYFSDRSTQVETSLAALNADSTVLRAFDRRVLESSGVSAVVAESVDIAEWPSGVYLIRLIVFDQEKAQADTAFAPFQILSDEMLAEAAAGRGSLDPYSKLSLDQKIQLVTYLLAPTEEEVLSRLGDRAKLNYLDRWWEDHDEHPETPEIENRLDLIERYQDANRLFSSNTDHTDGWSSHLGRVLMKYGRPSKIEDNTAAWLTGTPVQVWYYWELEEGKFFIFEEGALHYDFILVHSNVDGEPYSDEWQQLLDEEWFDMGSGAEPVPGDPDDVDKGP